MQKDSIKREQSQAGLSFAERKNQRSAAGGKANFRPKVKRNKLLLLLALLLTAATGAWADETPLLTIESKDYVLFTSESKTFDDKVTVTFSNEVYNDGDDFGWYSSGTGSLLTVTGINGYTITSCKFYVKFSGTAMTGYTVEGGSPSVYLYKGKVYTDDSQSVNLGTAGVTKIEVYGGVAPAGYTVSMKDGVKDAGNWTVKVGEGQAQALPIGGLKGDGSETVTLQYNGRLKVKGVKATSDAGAPAGPTLATPLTIEAITAGTIVVNSPKNGMKYSLNGGAKTDVSGNTANITVTAGDKVAFYGNGTSITVYDGTKIGNSGEGFTCKVYGNIMSLLDEEGYETATAISGTYVFYELFLGNTALTDASQLLLPATELGNSCYYSMFRYCDNLTAGPAELPATELANSCYSYMFYNCSSLTAAPELPATTLATSCYRYMFQNCSSLTAAPELPATTLATNCYRQMFQGCSNLSSVTCLATSGINESNSTTNWLNGAGSNVTGTKTFTAATSAEWPEGNNGIPEGWTRVNKQ